MVTTVCIIHGSDRTLCNFAYTYNSWLSSIRVPTYYLIVMVSTKVLKPLWAKKVKGLPGIPELPMVSLVMRYMKPVRTVRGKRGARRLRKKIPRIQTQAPKIRLRPKNHIQLNYSVLQFVCCNVLY